MTCRKGASLLIVLLLTWAGAGNRLPRVEPRDGPPRGVVATANFSPPTRLARLPPYS